MPNDPSSSVSVSGITEAQLAALQQAGLLAGQSGLGVQTPSVDQMRYETQVAPAYTPAPSPSVLESLPSMDEINNYLTNLPVQAQRLLTNPAAFTEMLTGKNPLPEQTGFAASATGLPAQNPNSLFTPEGMAYNKGYESGEPVSIAAMGVPTLAPAGRMLGSAAADRIMAGKALIPGTNTEYLNPQILSAVKEKGGNWAQNSVNRLDALKYPIQNVGNSKFDFIRDNTNPAKVAEHIAELQKVGYSPEQIREVQNEIAINKWVDSKIKPYIRNEMGTPTDPVLALHEQGISHIPDIGTEHFDPIWWIKEQRQKAGMPESGFAKSPQAKDWENRADQSINNTPAQFIAPGSNNYSADLGVLAGKNPDATVHELSTNARQLGFEHLTDELKNAIAHNSDLPAHLRLKPETLEKMTVPHAVKHVAKINKYRAEQMAQAAKDGLKDFPIVHEGGNGYNIHEIKTPELGSEYKFERLEPFDNKPSKYWKITDKNGEVFSASGSTEEEARRQFANSKQSGSYAKLDRALKNEGEQMGHCVGGYTDSVARGDSRIFSLRDEKGGAHATVEAIPNEEYVDGINPPWEGAPFDIHQIKGKGNLAVSDKYRGYIKDWLNKEADKIGQAQDLDNIGVIDTKSTHSVVTELKDMYGNDGMHLWNAAVEANPNAGARFMSREDIRKLVEPKKPEGLLPPEYNFESIKTETLNKPKIVHHTSDIEPRISTLESRWMPNSISANEQSPNYVWGSKVHKIEIPAGAKVGKLNSIFDILPEGVEATPKQIGKALHDYAKQNNLDAIRVKNVHGSGGDPEWSIFNENYLKPKKPEGHKNGGRIKMAEGGEPPKLTPFEQFKIDNAERIRQGQEDIANRNKYNPYKGSDRPVPTSKGMSGGAGYVPGTTNPFNPDSPLNRKNGGKIPSIDEMRLTILRNK